MGFKSRRERLLWSAALVWLLAIYSTLYLARSAAEFLRDNNLLRLTVWTTIALVGVLVLVWAVRRRLGWRSLAILAAGGAAFLYGIGSVSPVEVKFHFVEYGLLAALVYLAWVERSPRWAPFGAIIVTALCGWLDEGIQYLLPNRYYGLEDVVINATAGALVVIVLWLLGRARRHESTDLASSSSSPEPGS